TTCEQDVLDTWEERLRLRLVAAFPARDEEMHRYFVHVLGEIDRRLHVAALRHGICRIVRGLEHCGDVPPKRRAISLRDECAAFFIGDRDEDPRLSIPAARREGARLAYLADQRIGYRIWTQPSDVPARTNRIQQANVLSDRIDVDVLHESSRGSPCHTRPRTARIATGEASWELIDVDCPRSSRTLRNARVRCVRRNGNGSRRSRRLPRVGESQGPRFTRRRDDSRLCP